MAMPFEHNSSLKGNLMLEEAITFYQKNDINNALKVIQTLNKLKSEQSFTSLQLEAVCLAKQGRYQQAIVVAELSLNRPHTEQEQQQGQALIKNITLALANDEISTIISLRAGPAEHSIISDDEKALTIIRQLIEIMETMGAKFHQDIQFVVENGNLSIESCSKRLNAECHMSVPLTCMPLLTDYTLSINAKSELLVKSNNSMINETAAPIMQLLVELFNTTDKITTWENTFPFIALKNHGRILNSLLTFRPFDGKIAEYKKYFDKKQWQTLLLEGFFGAREFTYMNSSISSAGIQLKQRSEKGLLGIIDFLNHKMGDSGYQINPHTACMNIVTTPDKLSRELFVQYGVYDPLQTFLIYGFVDCNSPILYSGKMDIPLLSGDILSILSMSGKLSRSQPLSSELSHLSDYLPPGIKRQGKQIVVSDLIIPNVKSKKVLREVLKAILLQADNSNNYQDKKLLVKEVNHIEKELLVNNFNYWDNLEKTYLPAVLSDKELSQIAKTDLLQLSQVCRSHITNYSNAKRLSVNFKELCSDS